MAIQDIKLGTQPSGAGGDTNRSANVKINENFNNKDHAASRMVGIAADNVVQVKDSFMASFGRDVDEYAGNTAPPKYPDANDLPVGSRVLYTYRRDISVNFPDSYGLWYIKTESNFTSTSGRVQTAIDYNSKVRIKVRVTRKDNIYTDWAELYHTGNTTKDSNGFLKAASPVTKLFANKIEPNAEAAEQNPIFKKVGIGHYLIKGTQGFATEGW